MASQQPPVDCCEAINGFTAASWKFKTINNSIETNRMASQQRPVDCCEAINGFTAASWKLKTINISFEKNANGVAATSGRLLRSNQWLHSSLLEIPKPSIFQWKT